MKEFIAITKALSDESRVRILMALQDRELCVCQLIELIGLAPSTVSRHMSVLKQAGLVDMRKDGRWAYYRLAGKDASRTVTSALEWLFASVRTTRRASEDTARLGTILMLDPEQLCRQMSRKQRGQKDGKK